MIARALTVTATALLLAGCGLPNPAATAPPTPTTTTPAGARTPVDVVNAQTDRLVRLAVDYTLTQATWSPDTYLAQKARLARLSVGRARAELAVPAGVTPADVVAQLRAAGSSSRAQLLGVDGPNRLHEVVVAYKVLATGAGREPGRASYQVAQVTLTRHRSTWLVSTFAIQP